MLNPQAVDAANELFELFRDYSGKPDVKDAVALETLAETATHVRSQLHELGEWVKERSSEMTSDLSTAMQVRAGPHDWVLPDGVACHTTTFPSWIMRASHGGLDTPALLGFVRALQLAAALQPRPHPPCRSFRPGSCRCCLISPRPHLETPRPKCR